MLRCIAVDDEPLALELLIDNIGKVPFLKLVGSCSNPVALMTLLQEKEADLIFLDIQMPGMTGMQFLQGVSQRPMVILVTAYEKHALEAFGLDVVDYLVKPVAFERFLKSCNKARELHQLRQQKSQPAQAESPGYFFVPSDYSLLKVETADIVMVEGLKQTRDALRSIEEKIQEICSQFPEYEYLLSIPGFGPDVSSKVLGALGDPFRFQNGKQVLKLAGLDLNAERSGKSSDLARPVISKKGKADLRYALYQAALIASIRDRHFIVYFTNQLRGREKEPGIKTKMRVKLAAKLLIMAWTLMRKKEPFNPDYLTIV